jgi:hypothetical protein
LRPETSKTTYEIWQGKKPTVKYFLIFGSKCYILRDRSDEGIFLGYSTNSRACRVYNTRTETVMESINVVIDDEIGAESKGEIPQSAFEALPSPVNDVSKPSPSAVDPVSIPPVSPVAVDVPPNSTDAVHTVETDPTSDQELQPMNPPLGSILIILPGSFLGISMKAGD